MDITKLIINIKKHEYSDIIIPKLITLLTYDYNILSV